MYNIFRCLYIVILHIAPAVAPTTVGAFLHCYPLLLISIVEYCHLTLEHMFVIIKSLRLQIKHYVLGDDHVNYKGLIIELLEKANQAQLKRLYHFIKKFLGSG